MIDFKKYTFEELAHALYMKGEALGYQKITDKTGWREYVMGEKLNHKAYQKISSGCNSDGEGSDAKCNLTGRRAEYKSKALDDKDLNNLLQRSYGKNGKRNYVPLKITGVYNNATKPGALEKYKAIDHYFGCFYKEKCVLIVQVNTKHVIRCLEAAVEKKKTGNSTTTNLCQAVVDLADTHLYRVAFKDHKWFKENA